MEWIYHILLNYFPFGAHLEFFQVPSNINNAPVNILFHYLWICVQSFLTFRYTSRSGTVRLKKWTFTFRIHCGQTAFKRDDRSVSGVWFFNRLTFGIWGKSQQRSGQNFYNCPSGRADVWLEIVLPFYLICSGFCIQMVCFLSPGNGDFSPFLSCLPHFLSKTVVGTIGV